MYLYGCVARVLRLPVTRACACHARVYDVLGSVNGRHMMTISVIFPGVRAGSDALDRWSFVGLTFHGFDKSDITEDSETVIKLLIFTD